MQWLFALIFVALTVAIFYEYFKKPLPFTTAERWLIAAIYGGGVGNMIDRFRLKYVVDFIDVRCFGKLWVWVFNIADCCVVIGCIMLLIYFTLEMINDAKKKRADEKGTDDAEA